MIFGPDLSVVQERAKAQVMDFFVSKAEADGTPATLRAMYVMKAAEAEKVLLGGSSALVEGEAEMRGVTPKQLATTIVALAGDSSRLELTRMQVNVNIEKATSEAEIVAILDMVGIKFDLDITS